MHNPAPYPKNPVLARIFHEIGYADELGSGIRNTVKYSKIYSGGEPQFIEKDLFQIIVPLKYFTEKVPIGEYIKNLRFSPIMVKHIQRVYQELFEADYFSSKDVALALGCSVRNAAKIMKTMYEYALIIKMTGYGKGKYKFNAASLKK